MLSTIMVPCGQPVMIITIECLVPRLPNKQTNKETRSTEEANKNRTTQRKEKPAPRAKKGARHFQRGEACRFQKRKHNKPRLLFLALVVSSEFLATVEDTSLCHWHCCLYLLCPPCAAWEAHKAPIHTFGSTLNACKL